MSTLQQVEDNVATLTDFQPLTAAEQKVIAQALKEYRRLSPIDCTECDYCITPPCPVGIDIPRVFALYNECVVEDIVPNLDLRRTSDRTKHTSEIERQSRAFLKKMNTIPKKHQPIACTECDICVPKCPQDIPISEKMMYIAELIKAVQ